MSVLRPDRSELRRVLSHFIFSRDRRVAWELSHRSKPKLGQQNISILFSYPRAPHYGEMDAFKTKESHFLTFVKRDQ